MKKSIDQMSLPLFDTTALSTGAFALYSGLSLGEQTDDEDDERDDDAPASTPVVTPARNFRLDGLRNLASDWKSRAADNLAAIRLMQQIEGEARNATPDEQASWQDSSHSAPATSPTTSSAAPPRRPSRKPGRRSARNSNSWSPRPNSRASGA